MTKTITWQSVGFFRHIPAKHCDTIIQIWKWTFDFAVDKPILLWSRVYHLSVHITMTVYISLRDLTILYRGNMSCMRKTFIGFFFYYWFKEPKKCDMDRCIRYFINKNDHYDGLIDMIICSRIGMRISYHEHVREKRRLCNER